MTTIRDNWWCKECHAWHFNTRKCEKTGRTVDEQERAAIERLAPKPGPVRPSPVVKTEAQVRKEHPLYSGVLKYFPDALLEVSGVSFVGNQQHNPGEPLHWAKEKSNDHHDCCSRHLLDAGTVDTDGQRHSAKLAWRALALLQIEIENERKK